MTEQAPIRVAVADDHPVVRAGITTLLAKEPDLCLSGETGDGAQVEIVVQQAAPDVLLLDLNMPGLDPAAVTRRLRENCPTLQILVLTAYDDDAHVLGLLSAGAAGYMLKDEALETLVEAIHAVARGESWLSQKIAARLAKRAVSREEGQDALAQLTEREREVLRLLAKGLGNDEIAARLYIARRTVQNHISSIYDKLQLPSRAAAMLYALRHGLIDLNEVTES